MTLLSFQDGPTLRHAPCIQLHRSELREPVIDRRTELHSGDSADPDDGKGLPKDPRLANPQGHRYVSFTMTSDFGPSRQDSDEEVRRLLKRAAELEPEAPSLPATVDGPSLPATVDGPSLGELEAIASEAGIHPALIRQGRWNSIRRPAEFLFLLPS